MPKIPNFEKGEEQRKCIHGILREDAQRQLSQGLLNPAVEELLRLLISQDRMVGTIDTWMPSLDARRKIAQLTEAHLVPDGVLYWLGGEVRKLVLQGNSYQAIKLIEDFNPSTIELLEPRLKQEKNIFYLLGDSWFIRFQDGSKHQDRWALLQDKKRIRYIVHLLENPNNPLTSERLIELVEGIDSDVERKSWDDLIAAEDFIAKDLPYNDAYKRALRLIRSGRAKRDMIEKFILETYENAQKTRDENYSDYVDKWVDLQRSIKDIVKFDPESGRFFWKKDKDKNRENARTLVKKHIVEAQKEIEKKLPHLYRHLYKNIKTGVVCTYNPETAPEWFIRR